MSVPAFKFITDGLRPQSAPDYGSYAGPGSQPSNTDSALSEARDIIVTLNDTLQKIKEDALMMAAVDSVQDSFAFLKVDEKKYRIHNPNKLVLEAGDNVLVFKDTLQIVEKLEKLPDTPSPYALDKVPDIAWADIGGLESAKAEMIEAVELPHSHPGIFAHYNKKPTKGILLYGPPGNGKTLLGKAAANALARIYEKTNAPSAFLYVKGPEILSQFVGVAEQAIRQLFEDARKHKEAHGFPAIIFIDEADAILSARGSRSASGMEKTIVPMFLAEMDGLDDTSALVILATNRANSLDPAVVREGRIDRKIKITRPTPDSAYQILLLNLKGRPVMEGYSMEELAERIVNEVFDDSRLIREDVHLRDVYSGAMLAGIVDQAVSFAMRRDLVNGTETGITLQDMLDAVDVIMMQQMDIRHDTEEKADA